MKKVFHLCRCFCNVIFVFNYHFSVYLVFQKYNSLRSWFSMKTLIKLIKDIADICISLVIMYENGIWSVLCVCNVIFVFDYHFLVHLLFQKYSSKSGAIMYHLNNITQRLLLYVNFDKTNLRHKCYLYITCYNVWESLD